MGAKGTEEEHGSTSFWLGVQVVVTSLGLFNCGYSTASISGVLLYIQAPSHADCETAVCLVTDFQKGFVVSSCPVGAAFGALLAGCMAARIGRRRALLFNNAFYIVGALGALTAPTIFTLAAARFIGGLGVGVASAITHPYVYEFVPTSSRGAHGTFLATVSTFGILISNIVAYAFAQQWRWVLSFTLLPAVLQAVAGPLIMPTTGQPLQASTHHLLASSSRKQGHAADDDGGWPALWRALRTTEARGLLATGFGLHVLQQFSGIAVGVYYAPYILERVNFSERLSVFLSAAVGIVQVAVMLTVAGVVDRTGRKPMGIIGLCIMALALLTLGAAFPFPGVTAGWVSLTALVLYRVAFALSMGPLPFVVTSEIFPSSYRTAAVAACWCVNWLATFAVSLVFLPFADLISISGTLLSYVGVCIVGAWFIHLCVPEMAGKPLEHLDQKETYGALESQASAAKV